MDKDVTCRKCRYSIRDWTNPSNPDHYCFNSDSEYYGFNTDFVGGCDDHKRKEVKYD